MTRMAANDRNRAIRAQLTPRYELLDGDPLETADSHTTGKALMTVLETDYLQAPAPKRRTWRVQGPMFTSVALLALCALVCIAALVILNAMGG